MLKCFKLKACFKSVKSKNSNKVFVLCNLSPLMKYSTVVTELVTWLQPSLKTPCVLIWGFLLWSCASMTKHHDKMMKNANNLHYVKWKRPCFLEPDQYWRVNVLIWQRLHKCWELVFKSVLQQLHWSERAQIRSGLAAHFTVLQ